MDKKEIWLPVVGYEGLYEVSSLGRLKGLEKIIMRFGKYRSLQKEKIIKFKEICGNKKYHTTTLSNKGHKKYVALHRLVITAFIPNTENKRTINHKNGIKTDNRVENLERATHSENSKHAYNVLGYKVPRYRKGKKGILCASSKKINQYTLNGKFVRIRFSIRDIRRSGLYGSGNIDKALSLGRSAYGYKWLYA